MSSPSYLSPVVTRASAGRSLAVAWPVAALLALTWVAPALGAPPAGPSPAAESVSAIAAGVEVTPHWWQHITAVFATVFIGLGVGFSTLAAVGVARMPDVYTRMQSSTKAGTLGLVCIVIAVTLHYASQPGAQASAAAGIGAEASLIIAFIFLTIPVSGHLIGRAAYFDRVRVWERTSRDDLAGMYDLDSHCLHSPESPERSPHEQDHDRAGGLPDAIRRLREQISPEPQGLAAMSDRAITSEPGRDQPGA